MPHCVFAHTAAHQHTHKLSVLIRDRFSPKSLYFLRSASLIIYAPYPFSSHNPHQGLRESPPSYHAPRSNWPPTVYCRDAMIEQQSDDSLSYWSLRPPHLEIWAVSQHHYIHFTKFIRFHPGPKSNPVIYLVNIQTSSPSRKSHAWKDQTLASVAFSSSCNSRLGSRDMSICTQWGWFVCTDAVKLCWYADEDALMNPYRSACWVSKPHSWNAFQISFKVEHR